MKNFYLKIAISALIIPSIGASFAFAQSTTTPDAKEIKDKEVSQVEISFPILKDDFLLFYGTTKDEETNLKIETLRKDFVEKFKELKSEYKESFENITKDQEVSPVSFVEEVPEVKPVKSTKTDVSKNIKTQVITPVVKKYIITEKVTGEEVIVPASINIINEKAEKRTENSSWFQKVKSFFNW